MKLFDYKNVQPIKLSDMFPKNEEERKAIELWNAITTAIYVSGHRGEDVTFLGIATLKKLGRYDLLPPCEKEKDLINRAAKYFLDAFLKDETEANGESDE